MRKFEFTKDYVEMLKDEFDPQQGISLEEFLEEKKDVLLPKRATSGSGGYDLVVPFDIVVPSYFRLFFDQLDLHANLDTMSDFIYLLNHIGVDNPLLVDKALNPTLVPTYVKAKMEDDEVLKIYARSSLFKRHKLILSNSVGIIDSSYYGNPDNDGHIMIPVINLSWEDKVIKRGERIAQGVFQKYLITDDDKAIGDRTGGFGSTNR